MKQNRLTQALLLALSSGLVLSSPVSAQDGTASKIRDLEERIKSLESQDNTDTKLKGALKFASENGDFKFQVGGRIMADAAFYSEDNVDLDGENGTEIRRGRLFVKGTMYNVWDWKAQYDFASSDEIKDLYLRYTGWEPARITVGNFKQPASLEELTSSKYITFMERSLPNAFATGRRIGVMADHMRDNYTLAASVYGQDANDNSSSGDEGFGFGGRATWAPVNTEGQVIHLGGWGAWEEAQDDEADNIRFRARPESHITSTRLVNTGQLDADSKTSYGFEAAGVMGPFSLQGEYMTSSVDSNGAGSDPDFSGWYVYGSYFLTGESRPYKKGAFSRVKPHSVVGKGGYGAWELALRYSSLDLEDGSVTGGESDNLTVGVNWYATPYVRFMANYVRAESDPFSSEITTPQDDDELDIFQVRAQIDF